MRAWITRDYDGTTRLIWSSRPARTIGSFNCGEDVVMSYLRDDEYPEHQPQPGECIELNIEQVPAEVQR